MKSPKGFRGKYFSLAAILALNATITLASNVQSVVDTQEQLQHTSENATSEEETLASELSAPVMVVSKKIKVSEVGAPFASEVYSKKEIQKSHSKDIYEFLNSQTSVFTMPSYGNPFTQNIDMRGYGLGYGYENTVISLNGRRLNNIDMSPQLLSSIPLDSIDKIEIIKGSGSVEYGDGANAGVINIITKDYDGAVIKSYFGDNGLWFGSLGVGIKQEKFSISGYIDDYSHDGFKQVANDGTKDESWNRNKSIKATFTPTDDLSLHVGKTLSKMNVIYANALTPLQYAQNPFILPSGYTEQFFSSDVLAYGLTYKINDKVTFDAQGFDEDKVSKYVNFNSRYDYDVKNYDTKLNYQEGNLKALIGLQMVHGERKGSSNKTIKDNLAVYAKSDYVIDNSTFSLGARDEKVEYSYESGLTFNEKKDSYRAYDVGYNFKFDSRNSIFVNYNHSFQAPDVDKFFDFAGNFNGFIDTMQANTINIGYNHITPKHSFKATAFYVLVDNEIYTNPVTWISTNFAKTEKRGVEIYDKYNFFYNLFTTLNYTYVDTKIIDDGASGAFDGHAIPGTSPHTVKISLGYNPITPVTLLVTQTYKSSSYAIDDFAGSYGKMESYQVTDLSATYRYKNYEFFGKINNVFDQKNAMFVDNGFSLSAYPINYERTFMLGMSAKF